MDRKQIKELPAEIELVRGQLDEWRKQRQPGQRIPKEVWSAAVQASRRHGLNRVSTALGLDYSCLKRRAGKYQASKTKEMVAADTLFVEVASVAPEETDPNAACVVELEKGNGVRMRICVRDAATVDWSRMKEAFLGA